MAKIRKKYERRVRWLVFVDTNVLLDFYRLGGESAKRTLATLEGHKASLITTDQVWMEFLKNRQKVMAKTIEDLKKPTNQSMPAFLNELSVAKTYSKRTRDLVTHHKKIVSTIEKILKTPSLNDQVYQCLGRIFSNDSPLNLKRPDKKRYSIRRLAQKRFALGYPPRKDDTLRFGDAINWEWIIDCAKTHPEKPHVIIVSRDGDYGLSYGDSFIINDWLRTEFRDRVSRQRRVELTGRLSVALKKLDVTVADEDVQEEERILSESKTAVVQLPELPAGITIGPRQAYSLKNLQNALDEFFVTIRSSAEAEERHTAASSSANANPKGSDGSSV